MFALNDALALGVLRALGEAGRRVPEDVAVIGFDNITNGRFTVPSLSTVDPGREEIAETAVAMLVGGRVRDPRARRPARLHKAAFRIVAREFHPASPSSAGPRPTGSSAPARASGRRDGQRRPSSLAGRANGGRWGTEHPRRADRRPVPRAAPRIAGCGPVAARRPQAPAGIRGERTARRSG